LVVREYEDLLKDVQGPLVFEDFEKLMVKHGFAKHFQLQLLEQVFKAICGFKNIGEPD
jgi:hypothetical protein